MRWQGRRGSENVEDRRGMSPVRMGVGGGAVGLIVLLLAVFLGADPTILFQQMEQGAPPPNAGPGAIPGEAGPGEAGPGEAGPGEAGPGEAGPGEAGPGEAGPGEAGPQDEMSQFVSVVLADTEEVWQELFREQGKNYRDPKLVLFRGSVESACGFQQAAVGPFYCPSDQKVYIDLSFFEDLKNDLDAPGDFAQAYVIAHEVGHHVQNLLGISDKVHSLQARASEEERNQLSVRLELQADFFAGVWAHHAQKNWDILEPGDVEEAIRAAAAIGDDRLQMQSRGYVVPESFTHGTSEQRVKWFTRGFQTGDMNADGPWKIP